MHIMYRKTPSQHGCNQDDGQGGYAHVNNFDCIDITTDRSDTYVNLAIIIPSKKLKAC